MGNLNEVYREIMKSNGYTQAELAKKLGYAGQATVGSFFSRGVTLGNLYELCEGLGYTMVIEKRNAKGKVTERYELKKE